MTHTPPTLKGLRNRDCRVFHPLRNPFRVGNLSPSIPGVVPTPGFHPKRRWRLRFLPTICKRTVENFKMFATFMHTRIFRPRSRRFFRMPRERRCLAFSRALSLVVSLRFLGRSGKFRPTSAGGDSNDFRRREILVDQDLLFNSAPKSGRIGGVEVERCHSVAVFIAVIGRGGITCLFRNPHSQVLDFFPKFSRSKFIVIRWKVSGVYVPLFDGARHAA